MNEKVFLSKTLQDEDDEESDGKDGQLKGDGEIRIKDLKYDFTI